MAGRIDRRKHVRIPMICVVQAIIEDSDSAVPVMLVDLSAGGARILSQFPLSVGNTIDMIIPLAEEVSVGVKGDVVWVKEMEMMKEYRFGVEYMAGIQFHVVNEKIGEFIKSYTT